MLLKHIKCPFASTKNPVAWDTAINNSIYRSTPAATLLPYYYLVVKVAIDGLNFSCEVLFSRKSWSEHWPRSPLSKNKVFPDCQPKAPLSKQRSLAELTVSVSAQVQRLLRASLDENSINHQSFVGANKNFQECKTRVQ